jgi:membrane protein DedA with SNARE-associated domain
MCRFDPRFAKEEVEFFIGSDISLMNLKRFEPMTALGAFARSHSMTIAVAGQYDADLGAFTIATANAFLVSQSFVQYFGWMKPQSLMASHSHLAAKSA